jgi:hypothetical protein
MILNLAAMAAVFVDQISQAPTQIVCVQQVAPEQRWKPLLELVQSVVPVLGGVWVAWMAFGWTSKKEHGQWIRDQRKAEWRGLLDSLASVQEAIPTAFSKQLIGSIGKRSSAQDKYLLEVTEFKRRKDTLLFVDASVREIELSKQFDDLKAFAESMKIKKDANEKFDGFDEDDLIEYTKRFDELMNLAHRAAIGDVSTQPSDEGSTSELWGWFGSFRD